MLFYTREAQKRYLATFASARRSTTPEGCCRSVRSITTRIARAHIGILQVWCKYTETLKATIEKYLYALSLGDLKSVQEIYEVAGVKFFFTQADLEEIFRFVIRHPKKVRDLLHR